MSRRIPPWIGLAAFILVLIGNVSCYSKGAPFSTCMTMFPKHHGKDKQTSPSPFKVKLSTSNYTPGQNVTLTLEADDKRPFRGIQISAHRKSVNTEEFQGTFLYYSPDDKLLSLSCMGGRHNQVTHKNGDLVSTVVLVWQAPTDNVGDVVFRATFVADFDHFWQMEQEIRTQNPGSIVTPETLIETPSSMADDIDFNSCGSTKGCFFYPRLCGGSDCHAALTYTSQGDSFTFEMMARAKGYVSVGFSHDNTMGEDQTVTCTAQGNRVTIQKGYNPLYYNERQLSYNLSNLQVKQTKNNVMCRFTRPRILSNLNVIPFTDPPKMKTLNFDLHEDWFLMLGWGYTPNATDVMGKHKELPAMSLSKINFRSHDIHRGNVFGREIQAHAVLMVLAWMVMAGLATVIARHYKDMCFHKRWFGTKVWFQVHRAIAVTVLVFTAISFIIIFVKMKKLSEEKHEPMTHAIVGITVGVAVCLQVLGGMLRPGLDSKVRPFFTWGHRILGQGAHILAAVNFYLAFNMSFTPKGMQQFGSIVVLVWIGVQILWEFGLEFWACRKSSSANTDISNPKGMSLDEPRKGSQSTARTDSILLLLYILTLLAFAAATLSAIFLF